MTKEQYLATIARLKLSRMAAGPVLGLSRRQGARIAAGACKVPGPVAKLLRLALWLGLSGQALIAITSHDQPSADGA